MFKQNQERLKRNSQTGYIQVSFSSCSMASVILLNKVIVLSAVTCSFFSVPIFLDWATSELGVCFRYLVFRLLVCEEYLFEPCVLGSSTLITFRLKHVVVR